MRWSIVRVIWRREMRDQLRDRRTLLMIVGLPLFIYPVLGFAVLTFAMRLADKASVIGVVQVPLGGEQFPARCPDALQATFAIPVINAGGAGLPADTLAAVALLAGHPSLHYPLLIEDGKVRVFLSRDETVGAIKFDKDLEVKFLTPSEEKEALDRKQVDALLSIGPAFWARLNLNSPQRAAVEIRTRKNDDKSAQAKARLYGALHNWQQRFNGVHLKRQGLPSDFDVPFVFRDPQAAESPAAVATNALQEMFIRIFPFMLVMWSLAGALYPAVDLCAGEKERGTMETLLITPAGREEIVWGKFLTIWVFSAATALLNLTSMAVTTFVFGSRLSPGALPTPAVLWCIILSLPLSAFFSAICLAVGAYARSSKEGQYYLMPLFVVTMPLIFLTLAPGVELNSFYSMVPVTGVALLMQRMMTASGFAQVPWFYFLSVLAPIVLYSWLALRWAIEQFQREEVLFREAERFDVRLWFLSLLREKGKTPTVAQAFCCFVLLAGLRWLSLDLGLGHELLARSLVVLIAFMATPPLFMALLLTRHPRQALSLHWPRPGYVLIALLLLPLADAANLVLQQFPEVLHLLRERQNLIEESLKGQTNVAMGAIYLLCLAFIAALSKEIAFRGLILGGLRSRFRPWPAILISSFLFAAYHLNVFLLLPLFLLGVVLGLLTWRSKSLLPAVLVHWGAYSVLILGALIPAESYFWGRLLLAVVCAPLAGVGLWRLAPRSPLHNRPVPVKPQAGIAPPS